MAQIIYNPRNNYASEKLSFSVPGNVIELSKDVPVELTNDQIDWLLEKYEEIALAVQSRDIVLIDYTPNAGVDSQAALPDSPPPQRRTTTKKEAE